MCIHRTLKTERDRSQCRLMEDSLYALQGTRHNLIIAYVAFDEFDLGSNFR